MRKLFFITISLIIAISSFAQKQSKKDKRDQNRKRIDALIKQEEEGVIAYKKHTVFGGKLINNGYGAFMEFGRFKSPKKGMLYQLEISEYKSTREEKQSNLYAFSTPYTFGKQNFFYPVKLGVQQQVLFGNKSNKNGVSITGNYGGGISVGLLRPYYVQLNTASNSYVKYESADSAKFLDPTLISGGPGFSKGWSDLTVVPGAYLKTALRFDYGSYNEIVSALEVGIAADYYSKKIPLMVHETQKQFFFTGYVAIIFGRRK
ncbi:MAG: hypothetical protein JWN83_2351 [Chitinophagaceae bacterium]|nr:hypothetical protein [Chitinophagaceae bacterium]